MTQLPGNRLKSIYFIIARGFTTSSDWEYLLEALKKRLLTINISPMSATMIKIVLYTTNNCVSTLLALFVLNDKIISLVY